MKKFPFNQDDAINFGHQSFFMFLSDFARQCAKGDNAQESYIKAFQFVNNLSLSQKERAEFNEHLQIFKEGYETRVRFLLNGKTIFATVRFSENSKLPEAV